MELASLAHGVIMLRGAGPKRNRPISIKVVRFCSSDEYHCDECDGCLWPDDVLCTLSPVGAHYGVLYALEENWILWDKMKASLLQRPSSIG